LLRFLQDLRYRPLGTTRDEQAEVRIIAATNANLQELVTQREFRPDLLYRLKIFCVTVPPLRERAGDAELLASHFATLYSAQYKMEPRPIRPVDLEWFRSYSWPGNVRELENLIHQAVVQSEGMPMIELRLPSEPSSYGELPAVAGDLAPLEMGFSRAKAAAIRAFERAYVERALAECGGNVSAAARLSRKERRAFGRLMKKHGVGKPQPADLDVASAGGR
jgi:DNA-binding NtrC family response regulator